MTKPVVERSQGLAAPGADHADVQAVAPARSLWADAWYAMRRRPLFWVAVVLVGLFVVMSIVPGLFTSKDPGYADLMKRALPPSSEAIFGYDLQGYDVFARCVYGARASILVGIGTALATAVLGSILGTIAGSVGGWLDAVLSRLTDIVFAIPLLLGAIVIMFTFPLPTNAPYLVVVGRVVLAVALLGWPNTFRIMRSSVMQVKPLEYVQAARALGAGPLRIAWSHIVPNSMAPVIVVATINLGVYIAVEATLSYLGIGLQPPVISWGIAISDASAYIRNAPHMLLFPSLFLSVTVLAFIMLGDVVRDALDPKLK